MENSKKIILDLCGGTGAWSKPYKDSGYIVLNVTLPKYDLFKTELHEDRITFRGSELSGTMILCNEIYGILAAPTCTMFSLARTTAKTPRDFDSAMQLVEKCLKIIWKVRAKGNLKFWALENPVGYLRQFLGKPALTFDPSDYGANYTKKTDLWGYFNAPKINKKILSSEELTRCSINNRVLPPLPKDYVLPEDFRSQQARRSMTDCHFAQAFFKANK